MRWIALGLLASIGCSSGSKPPEPSAPEAPVAASSASVPTVAARPARNVALLEASGRVIAEPGAVLLVSPPLKGRVAEIPVRAGQRVKAGDALVGLVMPELLQAAALYTGAKVKIAAWTSRRNQLNQLKAEGLAKVADLAEAETQLADATAQRQLALATLKAAGVSAKQADDLLNGSGAVMLRATKPGIVTEINVQLGETRDSGGPPLVRVESPGARQIQAQLMMAPAPEATYEANLAGRPGQPFAVRIVSTAPSVDSRDGTWTVWFEPVERVELIMGQPVIVRRVLAGEEAAVTVPSTAIVRSGEGTRIGVMASGRFELREVEVIGVSGSDAIVRGQVKVGDQVASDAERIPDGGGS